MLNLIWKNVSHVRVLLCKPSFIAGVLPFFISIKLCCTLKISNLCSMHNFLFAKLLAFLVKQEILSLSFEQNPSTCVIPISALFTYPLITLFTTPTIFWLIFTFFLIAWLTAHCGKLFANAVKFCLLPSEKIVSLRLTVGKHNLFARNS